jgi:RHS repeat-associated protein
MTQQFDEIGRLVERTQPNGVVTSHQYDELSQILEIEHRKSDNTVISAFNYDYDQAGNIVSVTEADSSAFEYEYDETDQLVRQVRFDDAGDTVYGTAYDYDGVGNRLLQEDMVSGDTTGYSYGPDNRMLSAGSIEFSYDIGGNMVSKVEAGDNTAYEWDEENNLSKVTLPDGSYMELAYDGDNIRASRVIDGEETQFAWDPQSFNVIAEYDEFGNEETAYGPQIGMDDPWVMMRESNAYFFQTDHLNSVTELTDENEQVQNEYRYKAFGEALQAVEQVQNEYRFTARRWDGVDGIQFNRFRHYQSEFGRWNQWDVIRYGDGANMYGYVGNNPVGYIDSLGLIVGPLPDPAGLARYVSSLAGFIIDAGQVVYAGGTCGLCLNKIKSELRKINNLLGRACASEKRAKYYDLFIKLRQDFIGGDYCGRVCSRARRTAAVMSVNLAVGGLMHIGGMP